jgi:hypothetical protein
VDVARGYGLEREDKRGRGRRKKKQGCGAVALMMACCCCPLPVTFQACISQWTRADVSFVSSVSCLSSPEGPGAAATVLSFVQGQSSRSNSHPSFPWLPTCIDLTTQHTMLTSHNHTHTQTWPCDTCCGVGRPWRRWPVRLGREVWRAP